MIAPTNRLRDMTDAARGVVPRAVAEACEKTMEAWIVPAR